MKTSDLKSGVLGVVAAGVSSLCCLLPLLVILLGLGSGAFMMTTMRYRTIFIPAGVIGVGLGWWLYLRERRRCTSLGCRMTGGPLNLSLLLLATLIVATAVALDRFPDVAADLLTRAMAHTTDTTPRLDSTNAQPTMNHNVSSK